MINPLKKKKTEKPVNELENDLWQECGVQRTSSEEATFKQMLKHEKNVAIIRVQGRGFQMEKAAYAKALRSEFVLVKKQKEGHCVQTCGCQLKSRREVWGHRQGQIK